MNGLTHDIVTTQPKVQTSTNSIETILHTSFKNLDISIENCQVHETNRHNYLILRSNM